jgi:hypothetical protein
MGSRYDLELPHQQLRRLDAERAHIVRLGDVVRQWTAAAQIVNDTRNSLDAYTVSLRANAWFDQAGDDFKARVDKSVVGLDTWRDAFDENLHRMQTLMHTLSFDFPDIYRNVAKERDDYEREVYSKGHADPRPYQERAGAQTARLDSYYYSLTWVMIAMSSGTPWDGPRAALPGPGGTDPGSPNGSPTSGPSASPQGAGTPQPATTPEPATVPEPETPATPGEAPEATDPLAAAAGALQAAQGLLGGAGAQVPDAIPAPGFDELPTADHAYGQPGLAGLDTGFGGAGSPTAVGGGASVGGPAISGAVSGTVSGIGMTGPGIATPLGSGGAPAPLSAQPAASNTASARSGSPMYPPQSGAGAGAAGQRKTSGIKPGDSDRPLNETRPRPRRGAGAAPVTPGVALAGRAGAAQPKPAARRSWDSDNDSLRVLDEHLWQVNPEEETHGQDRGRPGRDGHDRPAAHRAPDAGLVGPGRHADQPTRAR